MTQIFGDFIETTGESGEYLKIGFSPSSIPIQQRWRTNGLSADFLADYLSAFFPGRDPASAERQAEMKDAVSYVANELLENAMKFNYALCQHSITIHIHLEETEIEIRFYVANSVDIQHVKHFQEFIQSVLTEDASELYMQKLMQNAEDEESHGSGLGFLTMLNNYNVKLAWKFETVVKNADLMIVTAMVQLKI